MNVRKIRYRPASPAAAPAAPAAPAPEPRLDAVSRRDASIAAYVRQVEETYLLPWDSPQERAAKEQRVLDHQAAVLDAARRLVAARFDAENPLDRPAAYQLLAACGTDHLEASCADDPTPINMHVDHYVWARAMYAASSALELSIDDDYAELRALCAEGGE